MNQRDITVSFINPPIPDRNHDWQATRVDYDEGDPIGHGPTPTKAVEDLMEVEDRRNDK